MKHPGIRGARRMWGTVLVAVTALAVRGSVTRAAAESPTQDGGDLKFEVTSVKPAMSPYEMGRLAASNGGRAPAMPVDSQVNGRLNISTTTLKSLVMRAYEVKDYQIQGGPEWLTSDYFEVVASAGREASPAEMRAMLKSLLTDRFALRTHEETRQAPVYVLSVSRADGELGPGLKRTSPECEREIEARKNGNAAAPTRSPGMPTEPVCGMVVNVSSLAGGEATRLYGGFPLAQLVSTISSDLRAPVIDRTGLSGLFDIKLQFLPSAAGVDPNSDSHGSPIGVAVDKQLGLRLEKQTGPLPVIVIDAAKRPDPN